MVAAAAPKRTLPAEAVSACQQPGVSIATVALERGLNVNLF
jgi:hypothetical protein